MPDKKMPVELKKERDVSLLNTIQSHLESRISDYCLMKSEDLLDEEYNQVIRAFFWGQGNREYIVTLTATGWIRGIHSTYTPSRLMLQICTVLADIRYSLNNVSQQQWDSYDINL